MSGQVLVLLSIVAATGVLAVLHCVASSVGNRTYIHDLRVRVGTLRRERTEKLRSLAQNSREVVEVDEAPEEQQLRKAA